MITLTEMFYKTMPHHCDVKIIKKEFETALNKHLKKFKWTIEYQNTRATFGDFHNIIGHEDVRRFVDVRFKTLLSAYKYSQTLENVTYIEIKKNGKEGGTTVLPGGFVIWTENSHCPFVDKVDINSPLFTMNKIKHSNSEDYVLKILKAWWKITPEVFKQYYPKLDFKKTMQKEFSDSYY